MSNIQFCHKRKYKYSLKPEGLQNELLARGGVTAALDLTDLSVIRNQIKDGDVIKIKASMAVCSDKDNYNRKVGRNIALGRLKLTQFNVKQVSEKYIILENSQIEFTILISGVHLRFVSVD
jgi:hypothetical protein